MDGLSFSRAGIPGGREGCVCGAYQAMQGLPRCLALEVPLLEMQLPEIMMDGFLPHLTE